MHTPTIYDKDFIDSDYVLINKDKLHHLENVLRVSLGSKVHVSNGEGVIGYGVKDKGNIIKIDKKEKFEQENKLSIFLSITNSINRIRFAVEKLTELGIYSITIGPTLRSGKKKISLDKASRWMEASIEQSGGAFIPKLNIVDSIDYSIFTSCLDINGLEPFSPKDITNLAIGPEGGWDNSELKQFSRSYVMNFATLRSETAAIVAATLLLSV